MNSMYTIKKKMKLLLFTFCFGTALSAQNGLIDKVAAVVGSEMILYSDVESEVMMMRVQGVVSDKNIRCEVFENMLLQKLLLAQARIDSLQADDATVEEQLDRRLRMIMTQLGGEKATEEYFKKPIFKLKQDWQEPVREQILTQLMQMKLMKDAPISPADVDRFYKNTPKDSLPIIPDQYLIRQIVINPPAGNAKFEVREQLLALRERIMNGEKFSTLAVLYSEDPSARRGGELGLMSAQNFVPAFADAALSLKPGQVSQIVETEYGFHIIQLISKEGSDMFNCRHILMKPKYDSDKRLASFNTLDSIADLVRKDSMTFAVAAQRFSQDFTTNLNGGLVVNENTLSPYFEKDMLNPSDYNMLRNMKPGDISAPFEATDKKGNIQYKIIQLEKLIPAHTANITDDYTVIQDIAKQGRRMEGLNEWIKQKQIYTYIRIDPLFEDCTFQRQGWIK
ncbi:MAG: peptidylprolyl isomerase [Prevotellaceae bacterium]|nr:peptidylprolyl isomerase [Prevotellaceae bacterium]